MKTRLKYSFIFLFAAGWSITATAQQSYLRLNTGYSAAMVGQDFYNFHPFIISNSEAPYTSTSFSLGQGVNIGGAFGYMFNEHLGAELGVSYLLGSTSVLDRSNRNSTAYKIELSSQMLQFSPSLVLQAGYTKLNPYGRMGLIVGLGSIEHTITQRQLVEEGMTRSKYNGGMALGFTASAGANYFLTEKLSLFAELTFIGLQYAPTKGTVEEWRVNGELRTDLTTSEREIIFTDDVILPGPVDPSQPSRVQRRDYPMSSLGVNIGLRMKF